jgi:hypothetical protein
MYMRKIERNKTKVKFNQKGKQGNIGSKGVKGVNLGSAMEGNKHSFSGGGEGVG